MMDKFAVVRSLVGAGGDHSAGQCLTGYTDMISRAQGGRPSLGAVVSLLQGPVQGDVPPFVGLSPRTGELRWGNPGNPGYLGLAHAPFTPFRSEFKGNNDSKQSHRRRRPEPRRHGNRARTTGRPSFAPDDAR